MESDKFSFKITIVLCFLFVVFSFCIRRLPTQLPNAISRNLTENSFFLLQHYLTAFGSTLSVPLVLQSAMCIGDDRVGLSEIISTIFFVSGLSTLLQTTFGVRHVNNILTSWNERHSDPHKKKEKRKMINLKFHVQRMVTQLLCLYRTEDISLAHIRQALPVYSNEMN